MKHRHRAARDESAIEAIQFVVIAVIMAVAMVGVFSYIYSNEHQANSRTSTCISTNQRVFSGTRC